MPNGQQPLIKPSPEFWEVLPKKTDAELHDMLAHPNDYHPQALRAARGLLYKRNPEPNHFGPERAAQLRLIGYWHNGGKATHLLQSATLGPVAERFPDPRQLVRSGWITPESQANLVRYLRQAPVHEFQFGLSWCRFRCGAAAEDMGSVEHWDGIWVWPEGLAHYIECHEVMLPKEFLERALTFRIPTSLPTPYYADPDHDHWPVIDPEFWIGWAEEHKIPDETAGNANLT